VLRDALEVTPNLLGIQNSAAFSLDEDTHRLLGDECVWDAGITSDLLLECKAYIKLGFKQ
jgi:hypothetical protein